MEDFFYDAPVVSLGYRLGGERRFRTLYEVETTSEGHDTALATERVDSLGEAISCVCFIRAREYITYFFTREDFSLFFYELFYIIVHKYSD
jgi:hypothetical protein